MEIRQNTSWWATDPLMKHHVGENAYLFVDTTFKEERSEDLIDLEKYGYKGNVGAGYIWDIALNRAATWEDGTEIKAVFNILNEHYDRIFLFSDMQVMDPNPWYGNAAYQMFDEYKKIYGDSKIYSFDLGNYHTQLVSDRQDLVYITALNDVVFKIIEMLEDPKKSLIDIVKNYEV